MYVTQLKLVYMLLLSWHFHGNTFLQVSSSK